MKTVLARAYADSDKTRDNYMHRLERLQDVVNDHHRQQGTQPTATAKMSTKNANKKRLGIYDILARPDASYAMLRHAYPNVNTRKNMLTLILTLFRHSPELSSALPDEAARWRKFHADMSGFQAARAAKNEPSARQLAGYVPMDDIVARYRELRRGKQETLAASQELILMSIAASVPPKRCDYTAMRVVDSEAAMMGRNDENYVVIPPPPPRKTLHSRPSSKKLLLLPRRAYFVFNKYKTQATYGRVDQPLPPELEEDIRTSLRRYPRAYLFVNRFNEPFSSNNGFGKFAARVFEKHLGRHMGPSMLRHIYISDRVDLNESGEALADVATLMMHSKNVQQQYKWSHAGLCTALTRAANSACDDQRKSVM